MTSRTLLNTLLAASFLVLGQACAQDTVQNTVETATTKVETSSAAPAQSGAGYLMVTGWYKDTAIQKAYIEKVGPVIREHGLVTAKMGVPAMNLKVLEGSWTPRPFSLMHFTSEKDVMDFWNSDAYQNDVKPIRLGQSAVDVIKFGAAYGTKPTLDDQAALLVFFADVTDRKTLMEQYVMKAPAIVQKHGGKFLISAAQKDSELLEGDYPSQSIVVIEFPSAEKLTAFWNDEDYKALSEIRKSTGKWSAVQIMPFSR